MITSYLRLLRPMQWAKNAFVFLPLFFAGRLLDSWCWQQSVAVFISFSMMASAIYCFNDIIDVEADRKHPKKCKRPIASGAISFHTAVIVMIILVALSFALIGIMVDIASVKVGMILLLYLVLNIAYCLKLKQYAIIDVFIVSFGFVLRLVAGGIACAIWLSPWIVLMTFLIALFLAFAKRRDDVMMYEETGFVARKNVVRYNLAFMNQTLGLIGAITIVCYIIYTVSPEVVARFNSQYVYVSSIFVLAGILRYLQVAIVDGRSGSPTKILFQDRFIQCCIVLWLAIFIAILYL